MIITPDSDETIRLPWLSRTASALLLHINEWLAREILTEERRAAELCDKIALAQEPGASEKLLSETR